MLISVSVLGALVGGRSGGQVLHTLEPANPEDLGRFGYSVSDAGDVNGDGWPDLVMGAFSEDGGAIDAGRVYVFDGHDAIFLLTVESANSEPDGWFGWSVSGAGDVNGDGLDDIVVGARKEDGGAQNAGRAYVFSGNGGVILHTLKSPRPQAWAWFGWSVSSFGDFNDDGHDDVLVGAPYEDGGASESGKVYVFSGVTGDTLWSLQSPSPEWGGAFGHSVSGGADINNDGTPDVIVGAYQEDGGAPNAGKAYVLSGVDGSLVHAFESPNPESYGYFGYAVSGVGDVDSDGYDDVVVGAYFEDAGGEWNAGRAYVFRGNVGALLYALDSPSPCYEGQFGASVSGAGDVNNDGYDDLIVGAPSDPDSSWNAGRAYIFDGHLGTLMYTLRSPNEARGGRFGRSVSGVRDVNEDGHDDVLVGAWGEGASLTYHGRAYVFNGIEVPVELASFTCRSTCEGVRLEWVTYTETDNRGFHVHRSVEGESGRHRVTQQLIPGAGTTTVPQTYSYLDPIRESGRCLYWLEQVDIDGSTEWHGPIEAVVAPQSLALMGPFPNPTAGEVCLNVTLPEEGARHVELRLYDTAGRLVAMPFSDTTEGGTSHEVSWTPESDVGPGLYWWRLEAGDRVARRPMVLVR
jgi:hypothetical protein